MGGVLIKKWKIDDLREGTSHMGERALSFKCVHVIKIDIFWSFGTE